MAVTKLERGDTCGCTGYVKLDSEGLSIYCRNRQPSISVDTRASDKQAVSTLKKKKELLFILCSIQISSNRLRSLTLLYVCIFNNLSMVSFFYKMFFFYFTFYTLHINSCLSALCCGIENYSSSTDCFLEFRNTDIKV